MEQRLFNEESMVRYLLGDLPEDEQARIEDRAFSDPQYMQDLLAVESDLIDEYVRGGLSQRERRQFEDRFFASHERRQKVEFARALAEVADGASMTETVARQAVAPRAASWWEQFIAAIREASPGIRIALAAASIVLLVGMGWLMTQTIRLRAELAQLQAQRQVDRRQQEALEEQVAGERSRSQELAVQLQREKEARDRAEELASRLEQEKGESAPQSILASLFLWPGISRSGGNRPTLVVPQAATLARLQVGLEPEDQYEKFQVELRTLQGREVWTQGNMRSRRSRAGRVLVLSVPARSLAAGEYELALKGVADQRVEEVRYYYFTVVKR